MEKKGKIRDYPTEKEMNDIAKIHFERPKNLSIDETIKDFIKITRGVKT